MRRGGPGRGQALSPPLIPLNPQQPLVLPQPFPAPLVVRQDLPHLVPELLRMVRLADVHELMDHHVIDDLRRGLDKAPAEVEPALVGARPPALPGIGDPDGGRDMPGGHREPHAPRPDLLLRLVHIPAPEPLSDFGHETAGDVQPVHPFNGAVPVLDNMQGIGSPEEEERFAFLILMDRSSRSFLHLLQFPLDPRVLLPDHLLDMHGRGAQGGPNDQGGIMGHFERNGPAARSDEFFNPDFVHSQRTRYWAPGKKRMLPESLRQWMEYPLVPSLTTLPSLSRMIRWK